MFNQELNATSIINILKMWSITAEVGGRTYSSLNLRPDRFRDFSIGVSTDLVLSPTPERALSNTAQEHRFTIEPSGAFQVGRAYVILKASHPAPQDLEIFVTAPNGIRSGGALGSSAHPDGSNINSIIGSDVHFNRFHELSGVSVSGDWLLEIIDPNNSGGHVIVASLFIAQSNEVSEPYTI